MINFKRLADVADSQYDKDVEDAVKAGKNLQEAHQTATLKKTQRTTVKPAQPAMGSAGTAGSATSGTFGISTSSTSYINFRKLSEEVKKDPEITEREEGDFTTKNIHPTKEVYKMYREKLKKNRTEKEFKK